MRADRLVATLLTLQARGRVTAAQLADELEISVATARRDLEALSAAGIPVYPQAGRGGGWQLLGGARTDLSGLTSTEAQALFLLVGPAASVAPEAKAALRKLVRALPETFRADAAAAADAVVIDTARWGDAVREVPDTVRVLQEAVVARRPVRFAYAGRGGAHTATAEPWGLSDKDGVWYLIAGTERGQRTYRVDRMSDVVAQQGTFARPADFDLPTAWADVVAEMERRRSVVSATVRIAPEVLHVLEDHFGRHSEVLGARDARPVTVRVAAHTAEGVAQLLAGWGAAVEVVDAPEVQRQLARIGAELVARYSDALTG